MLGGPRPTFEGEWHVMIIMGRTIGKPSAETFCRHMLLLVTPSATTPDTDTVFWRARLAGNKMNTHMEEFVFVLGGGITSVVYPLLNGDVVWTVSVSALWRQGC